MNDSYVMEVYFEYADDMGWKPHYLNYRNEKTFDGAKLWKPDGNIVCRWARVQIACGDERMMVFGTYKTKEEAVSDFGKLRNTLGYKLVPEHCYESVHGTKFISYGDG